MTEYTLYNKDTAPEKSKALLADLEEKYGMNLNILAHMAESPLPIQVYLFSQDLIHNQGTLTPEEANIVQLAVSVENECEFCVPAHSTMAKGMLGTDAEIVNAVRDGQDGPNAKYNALVDFARKVVAKRGKVSDADTAAFLNAGYTKEQIFEVLTIAAYKTITNYTSNMAGTQPNEPFMPEAWTPLSKRGDKAA